MKTGYDDLARGQVAQLGKQATAPGPSAPTQIVKRYTYQSYLDTVELATAIKEQNSLIVSPDESQASGYGIGLHPSSQTPVAVEFRLGAGASSGPLILRPGQIVSPLGVGPDSRGALVGGAFSGFRFGLPFGWLGGGIATLVVFHTPHANVQWAGVSPEIMFHRFRAELINAGADLNEASNNNAAYNWPLRFPWSRAYRGTTRVPQVGEGIVAVEPTRVLFKLYPQGGLTAPRAMRLIMQGSDEFSDAAGTANLLDSAFDDLIWPEFSMVGADGNLASQYPVLEYRGPLARLAANNGGIAFVNLDSHAELDGALVDVIRYGRL